MVAAKKPKFFATAGRFRAWLEQNHETKAELVVGYYKKTTKKRSMTWAESVEEALCFGWIDGVRRRIDEEAYSIRFTPRRPKSAWSAINVSSVKRLAKQGRMTRAGRRAFETRTDDHTIGYSFEQRKSVELAPQQERQLRAHKRAFAYFNQRPPWYQRAAVHWVVSAKRDETKQRRLAQLISDSAAGRTIPPLTRPSSSGSKVGTKTRKTRKKTSRKPR